MAMTPRRRSDFGFSIASVNRGEEGGLMTVARFQCVECGALLEKRVKSDCPLNPEGYAKAAILQGWKADAWKKSLCYCPKCAGPQRKPANNPDSELKKVVQLAVVQAVPREITPDQKQRIRAMLDKHFDDAVGCYLDEMSDHRIAELIGVPRIHVEQIREVGYGAIRITPELATLRADLAAAKTMLDDERKRIDDLTRKIVELSSKAEKMAGGKAA